MSHSIPIQKIQIKGLAIVICSAMLFGVYPAASQMAYRAGANATVVIVFTTFARAFLQIAICVAQKKKFIPRKSKIAAIVSAGFFQALSIVGILASLQYISAPVTVTIVFTHTLMLFLYSAYRREVVLQGSTVLSIVIALLGVTLVVDFWAIQDSKSYIGFLLAFMAAIASAVRMYLFGRQLQNKNPAIVGAQVMTVSLLFTLLLFFYQAPILPQTWQGGSWLLLSGLTLALATCGMFYGIAQIGSFQFSLFMKIEPIFTALFSMLFLGNFLKLQQYGGMLLVIISLVAYQLYAARNRSA